VSSFLTRGDSTEFSYLFWFDHFCGLGCLYCFFFTLFATISVPRIASMATTLHCLSILHLLPRTHHPKTLNSLKPITTKSQPCKTPEIPSTPNALQLLKSSSLPLAVIALPFFLDPQVIKKFHIFPQ